MLSEIKVFLIKIMPKRVLYWQVAFTLLAFAAMVIVSNFLMSATIRSQLSRNSEAALDLAIAKIDIELRGPETTFRTFAETVKNRLLQGAGADNILELLLDFNDHLLYHAKDETTPFYLFGVFYTFDTEPVFLHSGSWAPPAGYVPRSRPWYQAAVAGEGRVERSELYLDISSDQYVFTIAQAIHDDSGQLLGIVSLQVPISLVGEIVIKTAEEQGGYGLILGQDMKVYAHVNHDFIGMVVPDPALPISIFHDDFLKGDDVFERPIISYEGEESLAFFRKTQDGWYYGTIMPSAPYYKSITNIWYALVAMGIGAAVFLILILISTDAKKNRAVALTDALNKMSEIFLAHGGKTFEDTMSMGGDLLAGLAEVDRFSLFLNSTEDSALYMSQIYRWEKASGGTTKINDNFVHVAYRQVAPVWEDMYKEGKSLNGPVRLMPESEAALLNSFGIRSAFLAPIHINGAPWGFVLFEDHKKERTFNNDVAKTMQSAAFLFANAVISSELEVTLASERDFTQKIIDAAPIGVNIWDNDFNLIGCNETVQKIFGCTKQYYIDNFYEFSPEYQPDGTKAAVKAKELLGRVHVGETVVSEWEHRSAAGELIPCEVTQTNIVYNNKEVAVVYIYDLRNLKKMEKAVLDARQAQTLIDAVPLSCTLTDKNFNVLTCNKTAVEFFGLSKKDDIQRLYDDLMTEYQPDGSNSKEAAAKAIRKAFDEGYVFLNEWTHRNTNGELLPSEVTLVRVEYGGDQVIAAYLRDIRTEKEAEAKIREADERTKLMLDSTPLACSLLDRNYDCLDCNEEAVKLFEVSSKQEYIASYREFWPQRQPDGRDSFEEGIKLIRHAFEHGYLNFEWEYKISGEPVPCEVTLVRVEYGGDHIIAAYTRDLRAIKEAEAKTREADERAQLMLEQAPLVVMLWDENLQLLDCNQEAVRIFGLSSKKEYMEKFFDLAPERQPNGMTTQELFFKAHDMIFKETEFARIQWVQNHGVTGESIPFDITLVRIKYKGGYAAISYGMDLRERNAALEKMREADKKAREADEWSMLMLDAMPLGSGIWTKDGGMTVCNEEAARLFDLKDKGEFIERFGELSPEYQPDGRPSVETAIANVGKAFQEGYCRFEWMHRKLSGEPLPVEVSLIRVKYQDDYRVVGYFRDLSELKESIAKMREADDRAKLMLEEAPLTIMLWDKNINILDCNMVAVRVFGLSSKKEYIERFLSLAPEYQLNGMSSGEIIQKEIEKVYQTGYARFDWTHYHGVTGELIPFEITWVRVEYKGEYVALSYALDLRERNAAIAKMREADERTQIMFDAAPYAGCLFDKNIKMFDCNQEMLRMCGLSDKGYFLQRHNELVPEYQPDGTLSAEVLAKNFRTTFEKGYYQYEFTHRKISGELYPVKSILLRVKYRGEEMIAAYFTDLTEQRAMVQLIRQQAEAEAANRAKSLFLANMSHEMRTPMNVIVGLTDLMLEEESIPVKIKETLNKINTAGNTLTGLINDVLDISKIEEGKLELTPITYDVPSLLNDIITLNIIRIEEKPITFKLDIDESLPCSLFGDDLRVKQIFNNLLSNAFKYTKEGTVTMSVSHRRKENNIWLSFSISDTGVGIRKEDVAKLFTDYIQVDIHANRKIQGTGLGLSITKKLVEMMNGEISVQSEYGKGTVFTAVICQGFITEKKIGRETVENLRNFHYSDKKKQVQGKLVRPDLSYVRVLVVDDLQMNLDVAAGMFRKYKMQVDCVLSGQESINLITAKEPVYDAIFMDHMMPGIDGMEATKRIRNLGTEYAKGIPIIALTANAVAGNEQMFLENGFNAFLPKPFNVANLDKVIQRWVRDKSREKGRGNSEEVAVKKEE